MLANSFINSDLSVWRGALKRTLRLFLPVLVAGVFALILALGINSIRDKANISAGSNWLNSNYHNPMSRASVLHDVLLNSMFLGYQGSSFFQSFDYFSDNASLPTSSASPEFPHVDLLHINSGDVLFHLTPSTLYFKHISRFFFIISIIYHFVIYRHQLQLSLFVWDICLYLFVSKYFQDVV